MPTGVSGSADTADPENKEGRITRPCSIPLPPAFPPCRPARV